MTSKSEISDRAVQFYEGGKDHAGRTLNRILSWNDSQLESVHDYIQWLFPNRRISPYNDHAPLITDRTVKEFRSRPDLLAGLERSTDRMERFYLKPGQIQSDWVTPRNHNYLHITRIILALRELHSEKRATDFYSKVTEIYHQYDLTGNNDPIRFWSDALVL